MMSMTVHCPGMAYHTVEKIHLTAGDCLVAVVVLQEDGDLREGMRVGGDGSA